MEWSLIIPVLLREHGSSVVYTYALASDSRMDDHKNVGSSWRRLFRPVDM